MMVGPCDGAAEHNALERSSSTACSIFPFSDSQCGSQAALTTRSRVSIDYVHRPRDSFILSYTTWQTTMVLNVTPLRGPMLGSKLSTTKAF